MGRPSIFLVEDICENGLREPIIVHEGKVLHGRHRLRACQELGVEPIVREWDGECGTPEAFVASKNLLRRHLTESQRGMIAAELATVLPPKTQPVNGGEKTEKPGLTDTHAAKALQVSRRTVAQAKTVLKEGTPEEVQAA